MLQETFELDHAGSTIRGSTYRPDVLQRCPSVLMLHGFTGNRVETGFLFVKLARTLARQGIAAVAFDFRHSGESDGSFGQMLATGELDDALHMSRWLQAQAFVDRSRMAILGFSLGGLLAACANARRSPFRAMVLLAPTTVENLCRFVRAEDGHGSVAIGPHTLHPRFVDDLRTLDPVGDVVRNPRPTLIVQGDADTAVPPHVSRQYVDALKRAQVPLKVEMIEKADHGFSQPPARRQLAAGVAAWIAEQIGRS